MHINVTNLIRFPEAAAGAARSVEAQPANEPAEIVAFTPTFADDTFANQAQQHGQYFAAHRIAGRIADQLDAVAQL